jgi:hypothetical protein
MGGWTAFRSGLTTSLYNAGGQTTRWHGQTTRWSREANGGGGVRPPAFALGMVRLPEGTVRSLAMVVGVPALRRVLMGESTGSILDKNS